MNFEFDFSALRKIRKIIADRRFIVIVFIVAVLLTVWYSAYSDAGHVEDSQLQIAVFSTATPTEAQPGGWWDITPTPLKVPIQSTPTVQTTPNATP